MPTVWARLQSLGRSDWFVEFPASFATPPRPITIGRHASSTLCLTDNMTISNKHVTLEQRVSESDGSRSVVLHETSSNGTVVDGAQYNKGQIVILQPGSVIEFPCEDADAKLKYTFTFHVLQKEMESDDRRIVMGSQTLPKSEWIILKEECDELAREAARLAASVYSNSDKIKALSNNVKSSEAIYRDPLADLAKALIDKLKFAEEKFLANGDTESAKCLEVSKLEVEVSHFVEVSLQKSPNDDLSNE